MRRYELSDDEWFLIEDIFPKAKKMGRPPRDHRTLFNAAFWVLCSGAAWRDLPERFGPWQTAYDRFCKWQRDGTFDRIVEKLHLRLDSKGLIDYATWMVDATHIRAVQAAAGARKKRAQTNRKIKP